MQSLDELAKRAGVTPITQQNSNPPSSNSLDDLAAKAGVKPISQNNSPISYPPSSPNGSSISNPPNAKKDNFFVGLAKNIARPFAEVGTSAYNAVSGIDKLLQGDLQGADREIHSTRNIPFLGETKPAVTGDESLGEATKKMAGYGAQMASTLAPGAGEAGLGFKALYYGGANALGTAGSKLTEGSNLDKPEDWKDVGLSALYGAAVPVGGKLLSKTTKFGGNIAAEALGKTTGTSADVIREAFNNPKVIQFAREGAGNQAGLQEQALEEAQKGLQNIIKRRGNEYVAELEKIKSSGLETQPVLDATRENAVQLLKDFDIKAGNEGNKLNNLDFSGSTMTKNTEVAQKAFNDVMSWTDTSAAGLDRLKKRLGQYSDEIPVTERGGAHSFVSELQSTIKQGLEDNVPGYKEMTSKYAQASELIDDIKKALSLKNSASKDTAIKKLMSTMKDNQDFRKEFVDVLSGAAGTDIRGKLAGAALTPKFVQGMSGKIATGGASVGAFLHPTAMPLVLSYIAASSPRLVGELTSLLGRVTKTMISTGKFSPEIQNGIRLILQKSLES